MLENITALAQETDLVLGFYLVLITSLVATVAGTWLCKKTALKFGIVDKPDATVKTHKEPVAYLGGLGILVGLTVGVLAGLYCLRGQNYFASATRWLLGILAGGLIVCFFGVIDDVFDIKPWQKVTSQIIAAAVLVLVGIRPALHYFTGPLGWEISENTEIILGIPIVIIFVLGATNSLNLLDGLDGLCAGVTAIIAAGMLLLTIFMAAGNLNNIADVVLIVISLALLGGVCGFLPFNRHPAKIFMGDAGSMLLGFVLATAMILFGHKGPKWWLSSIVIFGLPILDTAVAFVRRWLNNRPLFISDRGHIYDQMMDRGMSLKKTVRICYCLAGLYALAGLAISMLSVWYALAASIVVAIISAVLVTAKGYLKMEGLRGAIKKETT